MLHRGFSSNLGAVRKATVADDVVHLGDSFAHEAPSLVRTRRNNHRDDAVDWVVAVTVLCRR